MGNEALDDVLEEGKNSKRSLCCFSLERFGDGSFCRFPSAIRFGADMTLILGKVMVADKARNETERVARPTRHARTRLVTRLASHHDQQICMIQDPHDHLAYLTLSDHPMYRFGIDCG